MSEERDVSRGADVTLNEDESWNRLQFGIYAGGAAGTPTGMAVGPPDDPAKTNHALDLLQGVPRTIQY